MALTGIGDFEVRLVREALGDWRCQANVSMTI